MIDEYREILFAVLASHSKLAQAEYERDGCFNSSHPAHKAEEKAVEFLSKHNLMDEYIAYVEKNL